MIWLDMVHETLPSYESEDAWLLGYVAGHTALQKGYDLVPETFGLVDCALSGYACSANADVFPDVFNTRFAFQDGINKVLNDQTRKVLL